MADDQRLPGVEGDHGVAEAGLFRALENQAEDRLITAGFQYRRLTAADQVQTVDRGRPRRGARTLSVRIIGDGSDQGGDIVRGFFLHWVKVGQSGAGINALNR